MKLNQTLALGVVSVLAVTGLGACGGSESEGGNADGASEAALADAKATVDAYAETPSALAKSEPLAALPDGVKVAFVVNDFELTHAFEGEFKKFAPLLGLDVSYIDGGASTDTASAAWDQAIAENPDVVVQTGWPRAVIERQLGALNDAGGKLVADAMGENGVAPDGIAANTYTLDDAKRMGEILGDWAVVATDGSPNVLVPFVPDFPVSQATLDGVRAAVGERCPDCNVQELAIKPTDLGTKAPSEIVSALQRTPEINVMLPTWDAVFTGVASAMKTGGVTRDVKVGTTGGGAMIYDAIKNGDADVVLARPNEWFAWQLGDEVARVATGSPLNLEPAFGDFNFPIQLLDADDMTFDVSGPWDPWDGYQDAYKALWGVS